MTVKHLINLLSYHANSDEVIIKDNVIKVSGKFITGESYEEYINSTGGVWEGGCGNAPDGTYCGECSTFDCDKCGWKERK